MYMACGNWMRDSPSSSRMMSKLRGRAGGVRAAPLSRGRAQKRSRHNAARASGTATPAETSAGSRRRWDHSPALRLRRAHPLPGAKPAALRSAAAPRGAARRGTPGARTCCPSASIGAPSSSSPSSSSPLLSISSSSLSSSTSSWQASDGRWAQRAAARRDGKPRTCDTTGSRRIVCAPLPSGPPSAAPPWDCAPWCSPRAAGAPTAAACTRPGRRATLCAALPRH